MKEEINVRTMTDDALDELMTNVINEREGTRCGTKKAERLDELYCDIANEKSRRMQRVAEDCAQSVRVLERLLTHMRAREITDEEFMNEEPRIRLSYGDYDVELPNLAQTYTAFDDAVSQMIQDITEQGW